MKAILALLAIAFALSAFGYRSASPIGQMGKNSTSKIEQLEAKALR